MTSDLWFALGYVVALIAIQYTPSFLYRRSPAPIHGAAPLYVHKKRTILLFSIVAAIVACLAFLGGTVGVGLALGWDWPGYVHAMSLSVGLAALSFHLFKWWMGMRVVYGLSAKRTVVASRGGWRSTIEWTLILLFVAVTAAELILHLR